MSKEDFRDHVATVDREGRRIWIYPRKPRGRYYKARTIVSWFLFIFLFSAPFVKVNGHPLLLFNILERKFIFFGVGFWPQDFHLFALALIAFIVFVSLFTVVFGRVFCGWVCPQTVFLEMLFRKIEYLIEGDSNHQRRLAKQAWNREKAVKKIAKHAIFYGLSFVIGNVFLSYIIGVDELYKIVVSPPTRHLSGFVAMLFFSFLFYGVFAWFREQACVMVCPYGRLQSVLLDKNSIVVKYDINRGEPRGFSKKMSDKNYGDCVDCGLCVEVCPTGIDIRNGTQMECVNCTACMDACDSVMDKQGRARRLIRYDSCNGVSDGGMIWYSPRLIGYSIFLLVLLGTLMTLFSLRKPVETTILRTPGQLFQFVDKAVVQNIYNVQFVNKSFKNYRVRLRLSDMFLGEISPVTGRLIDVMADSVTESVFLIRIPLDHITNQSFPIQIEILADHEILETLTTTFMAPPH